MQSRVVVAGEHGHGLHRGDSEDFSSRSSRCFGPYRMLLLCPDGQKPLVVKAETFEPWDLALDRTDAPLEARKDPRRLIISYLP